MAETLVVHAPTCQPSKGILIVQARLMPDGTLAAEHQCGCASVSHPTLGTTIYHPECPAAARARTRPGASLPWHDDDRIAGEPIEKWGNLYLPLGCGCAVQLASTTANT